jgi:Flp pilus assembly pilin Flp
MNIFVKNLSRYVKDEGGLVTIEWVGIAAVVVLAAIVIAAGIMGQTKDLASAVMTQQSDVSTAVTTAAPASNLDFTPSVTAP